MCVILLLAFRYALLCLIVIILLFGLLCCAFLVRSRSSVANILTRMSEKGFPKTPSNQSDILPGDVARHCMLESAVGSAAFLNHTCFAELLRHGVVSEMM